MIDYAFPVMQAERAVKTLSQAALDQDFFKARKEAVEAIKWLVEAHSALLVMDEKRS